MIENAPPQSQAASPALRAQKAAVRGLLSLCQCRPRLHLLMFYSGRAQLPSLGSALHGDISKALVKSQRCSFENVPWDPPWEVPKLAASTIVILE